MISSFGNLNNSTQQPQPAQPGGLFSFNRPSTTPTASAFGAPSSGLNFGGAAVPASAASVTYPRDTNFLDLPAELRQNIESLERVIQSHATAARTFSGRPDPSGQLAQIDLKLNLLEEKLSAYSTLHAQQHSRALAMKRHTSSHWRYAESVARTIEASRTATENSTVWSRAFAPNDATSSHFEEIVSELEQQIDQVETMAEGIQRQIEPLMGQSARDVAYPAIDSVRQILANEIELKSSLLNRYSQLKADVDVLRGNFRAFCSKFRGDVRDPFMTKHVAVDTTPSTIPNASNVQSISVAEQLPAQPKPQASGSSAFGIGLPSATTTLAPLRPGGSAFSGFNFGK